MIFSRASLLAALSLPTAFVSGAAGTYSYDPNSPYGPANWGTLTIEDSENQCDGQKNSPIAVTMTPCDRFEDYSLNAGTCSVSNMDFTLENNGVKVSYPGTGCNLNTLNIPGIDGTYEALQFHIHTSSEHTIDGNFFGAELHIVHKSTSEERYAVVGFMIQPGAQETNSLFESLLEEWQAKADAVEANCNIANSTDTDPSVQQAGLDGGRRLQAFNVYDLLADDSAFFHYDGGLTTPPCSEVVWWNLADKPVMISTAQYNQLTTLTLRYRSSETCELATIASPAGSTSRPVVALNGREVERVCPVGYVDTEATSSGFLASVSLGVLSLAVFTGAFVNLF